MSGVHKINEAYNHPLLQRALKFGVTCPQVMVRFVPDTRSERKRREFVLTLTSLIQSAGIPIIRDFAYQRLIDDDERLILMLEDRFNLRGDQLFVFLYQKMQLTIEEISQFLDISTELVIILLKRMEIQRRSDDLTRNIGRDISSDEDINDIEVEENMPVSLITENITSSALSGESYVGPLLRTMKPGEHKRILNARHLYIKRRQFSKAFYTEACMYRLLKESEEVALAKRIKDGDVAAEKHLVLANLRLVFKVAHKYYYYFERKLEGMEVSDLLQEGYFGLCRAVKKFDHSRGYKFSTYALWWIRQSISRGIQNQGRNIRIPSHAHESLRKITKAQKRFNNRNGHEPSIREIAEMTSLTQSAIHSILGATGSTIRIDRPISEDDLGGATMLDQLVSYKPINSELLIKAMDLRKELREMDRVIRQVLIQFSLREQITFCFRFGLFSFPRLVLDKIGNNMNLTRERIRQIEGEILSEIGGDPKLTKKYITNLYEKLEILEESITFDAA